MDWNNKNAKIENAHLKTGTTIYLIQTLNIYMVLELKKELGIYLTNSMRWAAQGKCRYIKITN